MERRQSNRQDIEIDIEIAQPGLERCHGIATDISRTGISIMLRDGKPPSRQRAVVLNVNIWTGRETLYRKIHARVVRTDHMSVALEFLEHDLVADAIVQDLMYYQERGRHSRRDPAPDARYAGNSPATV